MREFNLEQAEMNTDGMPVQGFLGDGRSGVPHIVDGIQPCHQSHRGGIAQEVAGL